MASTNSASSVSDDRASITVVDCTMASTNSASSVSDDRASITMWILMLLLIEAVALQASAQQTVLCGTELVKAHWMYCYGLEGYPPETEETNLHNFLQDPKPVAMPQIPERFLHRTRMEARLKLSSLLEDCCLRPCRVSELLIYC